MKLITFVIPSYNSEGYLASCLDSLLVGLDEDIEIIVVNDGSKDNTSKIAHEYADKYDFIRVIDKENGGHGSVINVGIKEAKGLYFKVLDSDDRLDKFGLFNLISFIKRHIEDKNLPDLYLADYNSISEVDGNRQLSSLIKRTRKKNEVTSFKSMKRLGAAEYFLIHMLFVKTSVLTENNVQVLEHYYYEDAHFLMLVLMYCNSYCYLDMPIYLYTVGREGQSVSIEGLDKHYKDMIRIMQCYVDMFDMEKMNSYEKYHRRQILHQFTIIMYLTFFTCFLLTNDEKVAAYHELLDNFKKKDKKLYQLVIHGSLMQFFRLIPHGLRGKAVTHVYKKFSRKKGWR